MSQTVQIPSICEFMTRHLVDVFETMVSMQASLQPMADIPLFESRVTGSVGFAGANVTGAVYLHMSAPFATTFAAAMLGLKPAEISDDNEVNDVIGEAANMVTGGLKSWLCDAGTDCAMSTPAIIRGKSFSIEPAPEVEREWLVFECDKNFIVVEIHIKLN